MPTWKEVTITPHLLASNKNVPKGAKGVSCCKCNKFMPIGAKAIRHRKINDNGVSTRYYCKGCYDSLWI